jgi:hypothetical protein
MKIAALLVRISNTSERCQKMENTRIYAEEELLLFENH